MTQTLPSLVPLGPRRPMLVRAIWLRSEVEVVLIRGVRARDCDYLSVQVINGVTAEGKVPASHDRLIASSENRVEWKARGRITDISNLLVRQI